VMLQPDRMVWSGRVEVEASGMSILP